MSNRERERERERKQEKVSDRMKILKNRESKKKFDRERERQRESTENEVTERENKKVCRQIGRERETREKEKRKPLQHELLRDLFFLSFFDRSARKRARKKDLSLTQRQKTLPEIVARKRG